MCDDAVGLCGDSDIIKAVISKAREITQNEGAPNNAEDVVKLWASCNASALKLEPDASALRGILGSLKGCSVLPDQVMHQLVAVERKIVDCLESFPLVWNESK